MKSEHPKWVWEIKENQEPIFCPCKPDWKARVTIDGQIYEDKAKYLFKDKGFTNYFAFGQTLLIDNIMKLFPGSDR